MIESEGQTPFEHLLRQAPSLPNATLAKYLPRGHLEMN